MLETLALVMLLMSVTAIAYLFIFIHDIPHRIAKKRHHPQEEAIHYACWLSLFTLHAIWPLVFLWAVSNPEDPLRVRLDSAGTPPGTAANPAEIQMLKDRIAALEAAMKGANS